MKKTGRTDQMNTMGDEFDDLKMNEGGISERKSGIYLKVGKARNGLSFESLGRSTGLPTP